MVNLEEIAITDHALMRYRRRLRRATATVEDVELELRSGRFRVDPPYDINLAGTKDGVGYVVTATAIFAIASSPGEKLCAATCFRRCRRSKAERRAYRELVRGLL